MVASQTFGQSYDKGKTAGSEWQQDNNSTKYELKYQ